MSIALAAILRSSSASNEVRVLDQVELGRRHDVLDKVPVPLVWHVADGASATKFDADRRLFTVFSPKQAMFGLGTINRGDYNYQVTVGTPSLQSAGIFLGYRTDDVSLLPEQKACFQFVVFEMPQPGQYHLNRGKGFLPKSPTGPLQSESHAIADVLNVRAEMVLEIEVRNHAVVAVKLDHVPCAELTSPAVNLMFEKADSRGTLGVITKGFSSQFKDAAIYIPLADN